MTDTSLKGTPRVGPCLFLHPLFDSLLDRHPVPVPKVSVLKRVDCGVHDKNVILPALQFNQMFSFGGTVNSFVVVKRCPSHRESDKGSNERQGPTLGVRFTEVSVL